MNLRPLAIALLLLTLTVALLAAAPLGSTPAPPPFESKLRACVAKHLGKPYVWGATGLKSFDCSGFVWRALYEAGIPMKRSTAQRYYMWLKAPKPGEERAFGNLVFFNDLDHVGLVEGPDTFFHAQTSKGTNRSPFAPYWGKHVCGYRTIPVPNTLR